MERKPFRLVKLDADASIRAKHDEALPRIRDLITRSAVALIGPNGYRASGTLVRHETHLLVATAGHVVAEVRERKLRDSIQLLFLADSKAVPLTSVALNGKHGDFGHGEPDVGVIALDRGLLKQLPHAQPIGRNVILDCELGARFDDLMVLAGVPAAAETDLGVDLPVFVVKTTHLKECDPQQHKGDRKRLARTYGWHADWSEDLRGETYRKSFSPVGMSGGSLWVFDNETLSTESGRLIGIPFLFRESASCARVAPIGDWIKMLSS